MLTTQITFQVFSKLIATLRKMLNLYPKNVSFPQNVYLPVGPTGNEEGPWLFDISVNMDRPTYSEPFFAVP